MQPVLQLPQLVPGLVTAADGVERGGHRHAGESQFFAPTAEQDHFHFRLRRGIERAGFELGEECAQHLGERRPRRHGLGLGGRMRALVENEEQQPDELPEALEAGTETLASAQAALGALRAELQSSFRALRGVEDTLPGVGLPVLSTLLLGLWAIDEGGEDL